VTQQARRPIFNELNQTLLAVHMLDSRN